ncbi:Methionine import ATP-binding protein MetN, partial [termite gut metagenome]
LSEGRLVDKGIVAEIEAAGYI